MARRARNRRDGSDTAGVPQSPYVQRSLPFFDVIDENTIERLEAQVDWIIETVGIEFRDDPDAHRIWAEAGAQIDETRVHADAQWIRELCANAPRVFEQVARNPARNVKIGGANQVLAPIYGAPFVRDLEGGRRYGDMESFEKLVKLAYLHPNLHHTGLVICEPCDVPVSHRHLDMVYTHMRWSDKPHLGAITEMSRAQDSVDMAEILHGKDVMDQHCVIMGNVNTNSPLLVDKVVTEAIRVYCGRGQGCDGTGEYRRQRHPSDGRSDDVLRLCAACSTRSALCAGKLSEFNEPQERRAIWPIA